MSFFKTSYKQQSECKLNMFWTNKLPSILGYTHTYEDIQIYCFSIL
jgi:hypothetical protein